MKNKKECPQCEERKKKYRAKNPDPQFCTKCGKRMKLVFKTLEIKHCSGCGKKYQHQAIYLQCPEYDTFWNGFISSFSFYSNNEHINDFIGIYEKDDN